MAAKLKLDLVTLAAVGEGRLAKAFDRLLAAAVHDCIDRSELEKPRRVQLEIILYPKPGTDGDRVSVDFKLKSSSPALETTNYEMRTTQAGGLTFHRDFPDDAGAVGLYDEKDGPQKLDH